MESRTIHAEGYVLPPGGTAAVCVCVAVPTPVEVRGDGAGGADGSVSPFARTVARVAISITARKMLSSADWLAVVMFSSVSSWSHSYC